jgi:hypothetical protein
MLAAPVGKIKLVRVCTVLELPENFTFTPGVAIAIERLPATAVPVSNQRPGLSVNSNLISLSPADTLPAANKVRIAEEQIVLFAIFFMFFLNTKTLLKNV